MERPYIGKSKPELTALAEGGDVAAKAELDYRANKKGNKAPATRETTLTLEQRMTGLEHAVGRCEAMLQEILELLEEEEEDDEEDDEDEGDEDGGK